MEDVGLMVVLERLLSVLVLVMVLIREPASLRVIVTRHLRASARPCSPGSTTSGKGPRDGG